MKKRNFGNTGLMTSIIGFGAGHIGKDHQDETLVEKLLNQILDLGINLIDTAHIYGLSEERIGNFLSHRRKEFYISSKGGNDSHDYADWTYDSVLSSVDESLQRMKTDFIDIYHLHSCSKKVLEKGEVIAALEKAQASGKIGIVGYSGENTALGFALDSNRFKSIQCSVNICDQGSIQNQVRMAADSGTGVIAKRPIANAPWRYNTPPIGHFNAEYWYRFRKMNMKNFGLDWGELAIRFSAFTPGVSTIITGTSNIDHLVQNIKAVEKGPLPEEIIQHLHKEFSKNDRGWLGLI